MSKLKPLNNRVLVRPDEIISQTASGILLATDKEKPTTGVIVVGNKVAKKGKRILFSKFGFDEVVVDNETLYMVSEPNILAIYE